MPYQWPEKESPPPPFQKRNVRVQGFVSDQPLLEDVDVTVFRERHRRGRQQSRTLSVLSTHAGRASMLQDACQAYINGPAACCELTLSLRTRLQVAGLNAGTARWKPKTTDPYGSYGPLIWYPAFHAAIGINGAGGNTRLRSGRIRRLYHYRG